MRSARLRMPLIILAALGALLFSAQFVRADDSTCTVPGTRLATADDAAVKNGQIKVGTCYNPNDPTIGQTNEQAKTYLRSILCKPDGDNYGGMGPDQTIEKLDAKFAVCAANFLKQVNQTITGVCVREGARTVAKQEQYVARGVIACKKGALCEHPRGVAIDINTTSLPSGQCSSYQKIHQFAVQFGLSFYLGCRDAVHFVPVKGGCSAGGNVPTDGYIPPSYYDFPQYYTIPNSGLPYSATPFSTGFTPSLTTSPIQSSIPTTPTTPTQSTPQICNPTYSCSNNTMYYQTTSCTTQVYQLCVYGCDGNACKTSSTTSAVGNIGNLFGSTSTGTSTGDTSGNSNNNSNTTNISDILKSLTTGNMFTATDVGTSVPLTLHIGTSGAVMLGQTSQGPIGGFVASGTIQTYQPVGSKSTFQTQDLANVPGYTPTQPSVVFSILDGMKNALLNALNFLRSLAIR